MAPLVHRVKPHEAEALRQCALADHAPLEVFLREAEPRIFLGHGEIGPKFRLVVKKGTDERLPRTVIERQRLRLWDQVYFRLGPSCRLCGQRIKDGEKALGFAFAVDRRPDHWRPAYIHFGDCPSGSPEEVEMRIEHVRVGDIVAGDLVTGIDIEVDGYVEIVTDTTTRMIRKGAIVPVLREGGTE